MEIVKKCARVAILFFALCRAWKWSCRCAVRRTATHALGLPYS